MIHLNENATQLSVKPSVRTFITDTPLFLLTFFHTFVPYDRHFRIERVALANVIIT